MDEDQSLDCERLTWMFESFTHRKTIEKEELCSFLLVLLPLRFQFHIIVIIQKGIRRVEHGIQMG
jgi:hypothetical protein